MLYDKDIREPLFEFLEEKYGKVRIIEEKRMGRSRADIVMVLSDLIVGIEIKSDADTYARLSTQVKDYDTFFDCNIIVAGGSHGRHIAEHVPEYWGIITVDEADGDIDFYVYREMTQNPMTDLQRQLGFLWRPELAHIQEINEMPRYKDKSKQFVIEKIAGRVPRETLKLQISEELFERDYSTIADRINEFRKENNKKPRRRRKYKKWRNK